MTRTPASSSNCTSVSGIGTKSWSRASRAYSSNNSYAYKSLDGTTSKFLKCLNYGFAIPATAIINGITVNVERKSASTSNGGSHDAAVRVVKADAIGTTDRSTATIYTTSDVSEAHGGAADLWGLSWTAADINASTFGAAFAAIKPSSAGSSQKISVDMLSISVDYTLDSTPPTVSSITRANGNPTGAGSVAWTVLFSESVTGVDSGDFVLLQSGGVSGASITSVSGSGTTWTVNASTGSGSGSLGLNLVDNDTVIDLASNKLGGAGSGNGNLTGEVYSIDKVNPLVNSINRIVGDPTSAASVSWSVVFSESVSGVDSGDFVLAATGGVSGASITSVSGSGANWTVSASTGSGSGSLGLNLVDNDSISDATSHFLGGAGAGNGNFSGQVYTLDRNAPTVVSINRADPDPSDDPSVSWTVVFSESVSGVDASDFALAASGLSGPYVASLSGSGTTWTVVANTGICSATCTLGLNLADDDTVIDVVGNKLGGVGAGDGNFTGQVYSITTQPLAGYGMDEAWIGTTDEVTDSSGNFPGTAVNSATTTIGDTGSCRYGVFDNGGTITKGYVNLPDLGLDLTGDFTITAWIRSTNNTVASQRIFTDDDGTNGYGLSLGDGGAGKLRFYVRGSSVVNLDTVNVITNNTWYYVAGVVDVANGQRSIYVYNTAGSLLTSATTSASGGETPGPPGAPTISAPATNHFKGNLDELRIYDKVLTPAALMTLAQNTHSCATSGPNHLQIEHGTGSGSTCAPSALTIRACSDAAPACTAYTAGVSGTLTNTGTPTVNWDGASGGAAGANFVIASGSSSVIKNVQVTTAGSVVFGISPVTPVPAMATSCNFGSPSCTFTATASGAAFTVSVPNHASCAAQTLTVSSATCGSAISGTKTVGLKFAYVNPASGASPIAHVPYVVGSPPATALNTSSNTSVNLTFDSSGVATTPFIYDDAGSLTVTASYSGSGIDSGLSLTGTSSAIVIAPASFRIAGIPAAPLTAGQPFNATVSAMNGCATPAPTTNFGRESTSANVLVTSTNPQPGMGNATAINTSLVAGGPGNVFTAGAVSTSLTWNEVGTIDVVATSVGYLGSALNITGSQAAVGRFKPAYFDTVVTPGCGTAFTYAGLNGALAGQPFTVEVKAKRSGGTANDSTNTANYAGTTWAKAVTLADAGGASGTLFNATFATSAFSSGKASRADVAYGLAAKLSAPYALVIRATDTDAVGSSGHTEGNTEMRSGRLRLSNVFGSEKAVLAMPVQTQYWSGKSWVLNSSDSCTSLPANAVTLSGGIAANTSTSPTWISNGSGTQTLAMPVPVPTTGSVDLAVNLGASGNDQSCLGSHGGTAASLPWLRSLNGNCAVTYDRDPSARATFGIYSPETKKTVHVRESY